MRQKNKNSKIRKSEVVVLRNFDKVFLYIFIFLFSAYSVSAANMTISDLINSYDFSYYNGTLNVTARGDYMIDTNSNGISDLLIINITTDTSSSATYRFIVEIDNGNGSVINDTTKTLSASDNYASINFPSSLLAKPKFNYSIRINDNSENLVFRKFNIESNTYSSYEKGASITKITDQNVNNNFIRINLTINSSQPITTNVTITLTYNSSTISSTQEKNLSSGLQVVSIDFDNETIKSTHYGRNFTISKVLIGNKVLKPNRNTSVYDYETFAKTSYIKSIKSGVIDTNSNNLSEQLEINFTVNVKTSGTYNITYDLYDEFDSFVATIGASQSLSTGNQTVRTLINGSEIYKTKIDGPYVVKLLQLLSLGNTVDIVTDVHTTKEISYNEFERPPLPDLKINLAATFNQSTNKTLVQVNVSNIGTTTAFNVILDIFDNITYFNNASLSFLNNGDKSVYHFNITGSSNSSLITAIVDFDNLVDEIKESNNIAQNIQENTSSPPPNSPPIISTIPNIIFNKNSYNNSLDLDNYVTDLEDSDSVLTWIATGNTNITVSINSVSHVVNFTSLTNWTGSENIKFTVNDTGGLTANDTILVTVNAVNNPPVFSGTISQLKWNEDLTNSSLNLSQYFTDSSSLNYNFTLTTNITISINNNTGVVSLTPNPNFNGIRYVIFYATNQFNLTAISNNVTLNVTPVNDRPSIDTFLPVNLTPNVIVGSTLIFNHTSSDMDGDSLSYNWKLDSVTQSSSLGWTYTPNGNEIGNHIVLLNASDGLSNVTMQWNVLVLNQTNQTNQSQASIALRNFNLIYDDSTLKTFEFSINNTGNATLSNVNWSLNTGLETIQGNSLISLSQGNGAFVFVAHNYSQSGDFTTNATAKNNSLQDSELLQVSVPSFGSSGIDVYGLNVLNSSAAKRLFEFKINNTLSTSLSNVNWTFDTKDDNILNSASSILLPSLTQMFVFVEYNFTVTPGSGGEYFNTNATGRNSTLIDSENLTLFVQ